MTKLEAIREKLEEPSIGELHLVGYWKCLRIALAALEKVVAYDLSKGCEQEDSFAQQTINKIAEELGV